MRNINGIVFPGFLLTIILIVQYLLFTVIIFAKLFRMKIHFSSSINQHPIAIYSVVRNALLLQLYSCRPSLSTLLYVSCSSPKSCHVDANLFQVAHVARSDDCKSLFGDI